MRGKTPRAISLEILNKVEGTNRHPDELLSDSFKRYRHLTSLDRAFLTELTYGVLRWREKLDWVIRHFSSIRFEAIEPWIVWILRIGLYQILYLSRTPVSAAVNESVELAKKQRGSGGAGFVNAVLRSAAREKDDLSYPEMAEDPALHLSVAQSHPLWLVRRWLEEIGAEETLRVCGFNQGIAPLVVRTNRLRFTRDDLIKKMVAGGLEVNAAAYSEEGIVVRNPPPVSELPFLREGFFVIQDEASQLVTSILDPRPGEKILDACAAPGGKTTHIEQRMQNIGEVYALDLAREKLLLVEEVSRRSGGRIVRPIKADASHPLPVPTDLQFDRVLADVPCSGFGTLRKNPDVKWRRGLEDIRRLSRLQSSILENVAAYLKPGGRLVYSTCTVFHEENEDVVEDFLSRHSEFSVDHLTNDFPHLGSLMSGGYLKTFPPRDQMDGFFVARLRKA